MNIAIIGTGNVGGALGISWSKKGHRIIFGARNPQDARVQTLISSTAGKATAASIEEAVQQARIVVLATPWEAAQSALKAAGNLNGKILIDVTNPLIMSAEGLQQGLVIGHTTSAAEQIAQWAKGANVVKAFNTIGSKHMSDPVIAEQKVTMFICGDDDPAKSNVKQLSDDLGFDTVDAGPLRAARLLEPLAMLWIHLSFAMGWGPDFGFKILKQ